MFKQLISVILIVLLYPLSSYSQDVFDDSVKIKELTTLALAVGQILTINDTVWIGTGFVAGEDRHIFTCAHVALKDTMLFMPLGSGYIYRIVLKWRLPKYDLAIYERTAGKPSHTLQLGKFEKVNPGDGVIFFGCESDSGLIIGTGVEIYSVGKVIHLGEVIDFLEFHAEGVVPGFSGGPVLNEDYEVVAMLSEAWKKQGIKGGPEELYPRAFSTDLLRVLETNLEKSVSGKSESSLNSKLIKELEKLRNK